MDIDNAPLNQNEDNSEILNDTHGTEIQPRNDAQTISSKSSELRHSVKFNIFQKLLVFTATLDILFATMIVIMYSVSVPVINKEFGTYGLIVSLCFTLILIFLFVLHFSLVKITIVQESESPTKRLISNVLFYILLNASLVGMLAIAYKILRIPLELLISSSLLKNQGILVR